MNVVQHTMDKTGLTDNTHPFLVCAAFDTAASADIAVQYLSGPAGFQRDRIECRQSAESQPRAAKRTKGLIRGKLHVGLGLGCLGLGSLLALLWLRYGPPALQSSPLLIACAAAFFCLAFGFVVRMVLSLRDEPGPPLPGMADPLAAPPGAWLVIVHCSNETERNHARAVMGNSARLL
ncbi:hypothetical protein [Kineobactrum salinum]|uniref:Uncharacterized protein n=1 Tax=Kineobactrum salinum TaxID=2708301 RepID=A0A6C0U857_9GAMM|nr:hypothetical protein [Kineobactrum salinum]QIB67217.1 hypothetical protein G3T16_19210 [Kineobactrum salinum]